MLLFVAKSHDDRRHHDRAKWDDAGCACTRAFFFKQMFLNCVPAWSAKLFRPWLPRARACDTDRINDTIDYGVVCERLRRLLVEHRLQLLEAFAESIADILLDEFGASWVRVKVVKPKKFSDVTAVGVQIERVAPRPVDPPSRGAAVLRLIGSGMVPGGR